MRKNELELLTKEIKNRDSIVEIRCRCGNLFKIKLVRALYKEDTSCGCKQELYFDRIKNNRVIGEVSQRFYDQYKNQAARRNLKFKLSPEDIWLLYIKQDRKCAMTGELLFFGKRTQTNKDTTVSIDRIETSVGYINGNVRIIDKKLNLIKWEYNDNEFFDFCSKILKKIEEKNIIKSDKPKNWLSLVCHIRSSAKKRKIEFNVDEHWLFELINSQGWRCAISGQRLHHGFGCNCVDKTMSLDRINNSHPYNKDNVWWIESNINKIKRTLSVEELNCLCEKVLNYEKCN